MRIGLCAHTPRSTAVVILILLRDVHSMPALERSTSMAPNTRRSGTAVCQAMPIAEVAGEFAEISGFATVMFAITLVVSGGCADCMVVALF